MTGPSERKATLILPLGFEDRTEEAVPAATGAATGAMTVYLDNTKPNAGRLLGMIDAVRPDPEGSLHLRKAINTGPASDDIIGEAAAKARLFITGVGD